MVGLAQKLVVVAATIAGLLGVLAEKLPESVPDNVPAACVPVPGLDLQAGYCP